MKKALLLFDVDGTLTPARQKIQREVHDYLTNVRKQVPLAVVGGSDLAKIVEQLADSKEELLSRYDYVFSENGLVGFKGKEQFPGRCTINLLGGSHCSPTPTTRPLYRRKPQTWVIKPCLSPIFYDKIYDGAI